MQNVFNKRADNKILINIQIILNNILNRIDNN
jgi:hypothetical protein